MNGRAAPPCFAGDAWRDHYAQRFLLPRKICPGPRCDEIAGRRASTVGLSGLALIIASGSARALAQAAWTQTFQGMGLDFAVFDFGGECSFAEISRGTEAARRVSASVIIGAGGGKTLDIARAVAAELDLPVACCPTTASSDAPCSALAVLYTEEGVFERCLYFRRNPDLVLVDSGIIARAPARQLIAGMGDALATCSEAEASMRAHRRNVVGGSSTLTAAAIARLCYQTLLKDGTSALAAARPGAITPAFERIIEANTLLSGLGFESGGLAVAHSVHNGLTAASETRDRLHGEKVAFGTLVQLVLEGADNAVMDEVMSFCLSVGLPLTLAELGLQKLTREKARAIAQRAIAPGESAHNEPIRGNRRGGHGCALRGEFSGRDFQSAPSAIGRVRSIVRVFLLRLTHTNSRSASSMLFHSSSCRDGSCYTLRIPARLSPNSTRK
nr:Iron-containing alcohol dehydrogenase [Methylocystis sp. SC2]